MSGALKAGSLIGFVGLVTIIPVSLINAYFTPWLSPVCGPLMASVMGLLAGFLGVRWGSLRAGIGTGTVAGVFTGISLIVGECIAILITTILFVSDPLYPFLFEEIVAGIHNIPPEAINLTPTEMLVQLIAGGIIIISCIALIYMLFALSFGTLGGWIAVRSRPQVAGYTPQQPPMSPSPPTSPMH